MKLRLTALATLLVLAVPALAQHEHAEAKPADVPAPAGGPSAAEMEAWQKSMNPGPEHQQMAKFAGDWTFVNKAWMAPGQPPMESTGTMHAEALMGGRYLVEEWRGSMMGQTFEGRGTYAFNNVSKQYESTWFDSMSTGIWYTTGTCDAANVCTQSGDSWDPMTGKKVSMRSVTSWVDANTFKMVMHGPGPDGKEYQMMEIVAKRK